MVTCGSCRPRTTATSPAVSYIVPQLSSPLDVCAVRPRVFQQPARWHLMDHDHDFEHIPELKASICSICGRYSRGRRQGIPPRLFVTVFQLKSENKGYRAISHILSKQHGILVSHATVYRLIHSMGVYKGSAGEPIAR